MRGNSTVREISGSVLDRKYRSNNVPIVSATHCPGPRADGLGGNGKKNYPYGKLVGARKTRLLYDEEVAISVTPLVAY